MAFGVPGGFSLQYGRTLGPKGPLRSEVRGSSRENVEQRRHATGINCFFHVQTFVENLFQWACLFFYIGQTRRSNHAQRTKKRRKGRWRNHPHPTEAKEEQMVGGPWNPAYPCEIRMAENEPTFEIASRSKSLSDGLSRDALVLHPVIWWSRLSRVWEGGDRPSWIGFVFIDP